MKRLKLYFLFKNSFFIDNFFYPFVISIFLGEIEWLLIFFISGYSTPNILNLIMFYFLITCIFKLGFSVPRLLLSDKKDNSFIVTNVEYLFLVLLFGIYNIERKFRIDILKKNFGLFSIIKLLIFIGFLSVSFYILLKFISNLKIWTKRKIVISILAILLVMILVETKNRFKMSESKQILLVSIDSLRPDHLSCYGYKEIHTKNIDDLAKNSILFSNAYCQAPYTESSLSSILSGFFPFHTNVRNFGTKMNPNLKTIAEILSGNNFDCVMIGGPGYKTGGFSRGFKKRIDISSLSIEEFFRYKISNLFNKKPIKDETICALSYINNNKFKSYFMWIHYLDPHAPYHPPGAYIKGKGNFKVNGTVEQLKDFAKNKKLYNEDDLKHLIKLYDSEVLFIDDNIDLLFNKFLKISCGNIYILTADHGEALGENGLFLHAVDLIEPMIKVPLILNCSWLKLNKKPVKISHMVSSIDIVPTILELLQINKEKFNFDGKSLLPLLEGDNKGNSEISYFETMGTSKVGISNGKHKFIYNVTNKEKELYCLNLNGKEKLIHNNLILAELEIELLNLMGIDNLKDLRVFKNEKMSQKLNEELRSLGYIN